MKRVMRNKDNGLPLFITSAACMSRSMSGMGSELSNSFYVMTGSMEPTIRAHSLIIAVPVRTEEVRVGDIVTYTRTASDKRFDRIHIPLTVVHRVIAVEGERFIFQGDHEEEPDPPVGAEQIGYRVVWIRK